MKFDSSHANKELAIAKGNMTMETTGFSGTKAISYAPKN